MSPTARNQRWFILCFVAILGLAGALRFTGLGGRPNGLFRDEAEKGYNAWALAQTGGAVDFSGGIGPGPQIQWRHLPWMINVMGGKTSAIYQYASVPWMWLGGLSVTTTRLTSALVGTLTVALLGWLVWSAWGAWGGMAAALWLALSPWHLNFSRWALEGIFVPFFLVAALGGLLGMGRGRRWGAPLAGAALGWMFYSYSGAQPFVAAWGVCLAAMWISNFKFLISNSKTSHSAFRIPHSAFEESAIRNPQSNIPHSAFRIFFWLGVVLFLIPVIPTLIVRLEPGGSSRLVKLAIWSQPGATPFKIAGQFIKNYACHFDPRFLFLSGDRMPRHNAGGQGQLLLLDAVLLPLGLIVSFRRRLPLRGALLAAFLCAPLPAAITTEGLPHALRAFSMVIPAVCWSGLGLASAGEWAFAAITQRGYSICRARWFVAVLAAACLLLGLNAAWRYWRESQADPLVAVSFEAGERQTWETLAAQRRPGQRVFINGNIPYAPYFEAFFLKLPPRSLPQGGLEAGGFYYYDPERVTPAMVYNRMAPGDWHVQGTPAHSLTHEDGMPLVPPETRRTIAEAWVWFTRK